MTIQTLGDDDIGYDDMGALFSRRRRRRGPGRMMLPPARRTMSAVRPDTPGTPSRSAGIFPAAWPVTTFALADGTNAKTVQMNPQTPLRGQRLVIILLRNGSSASLTTVLITTMLVGMVPIILTPDGVAADNYGPTAVDTNVILPPTQPGVLYQLTVRLPIALTTTDTITMLASVQGTAVQ